MENPQKKSRVYADDDDRISDLPESVICHILSFLPAKNVVATSILSKTWKFHWTKVTSLDFILSDDDDDDDDVVVEVVSYDDREAERVRKFVHFVNKVLLNIESQCLQKFRLQWLQGCHREPEYIPTWISYALARSIRKLIITTLCGTTLDLHLPGSLFTCATLEFLKLYVHVVFQVPSVVHLPKLEVLDLGHVLYESSECIPKLISGCPVLRSLGIGRNFRDNMLDIRVSSHSLRTLCIFRVDEGRNTPFDGRLEIDAPNLEYFALDEVLKECSLKRLTSVNSVDLNLDHDVFADEGDFDAAAADELYTSRCNSTAKLVETMHNAEFLSLEGTIIKALNSDTAPLSVSFERLIELKLSVQCCNWYSLGGFLGRSAKLRVLDITKVGCGKNTTDDHRLCWNDPKEVPECLLSSLEEVSFANFEGLEDEMAMVKYMLQHGEVLESFTLKSVDADPSDYKNKFQLLQQVSMFPRCSCACEIRFE